MLILKRTGRGSQLPKIAAALWLSLPLAGCFIPRPADSRLLTLSVEHQGTVRPDTLLVLLPGRFDRPDRFLKEGFLEEIHSRDLLVDVRVVDAHLGYYINRTVLKRLHEDIVRPASLRGYRQIWLVGISMGGLGSLLYAQAYPNDVTGLILLAPFLGDAAVTNEIASSGGLQGWDPPAPAPGDYQRSTWIWLKGYTEPSPARPLLYLGYGTQDRFSPANAMLGRWLPPERVFREAGGHDWSAWRKIWGRMLDAIPLPKHPPRPA
jgi:pimeloyl-ACP methyl ester carboxylesterase